MIECARKSLKNAASAGEHRGDGEHDDHRSEELEEEVVTLAEPVFEDQALAGERVPGTLDGFQRLDAHLRHGASLVSFRLRLPLELESGDQDATREKTAGGDERVSQRQADHRGEALPVALDDAPVEHPRVIGCELDVPLRRHARRARLRVLWGLVGGVHGHGRVASDQPFSAPFADEVTF